MEQRKRVKKKMRWVNTQGDERRREERSKDEKKRGKKKLKD